MEEKLDIAADEDGMFSFYLHGCTCGILNELIDRTLPILWIRRHVPVAGIQWWKTTAPLSLSAIANGLEVRGMEYDLQLPTEKFLGLLPTFENHGVELYQMTKPVPDTLTLNRVPESSHCRILVENGMRMAFYLPHAIETAKVQFTDRTAYERAIATTAVRDLMRGQG